MGILNHIINIIFPAVCKQCNDPISADTSIAYFCKGCWDGVKWFDGPCCPQCCLPYPSLDSPSDLSQAAPGHLCQSCHMNPPHFDKAVSAGPYEGVLAEAIKLFKYKKKIHIGRALVERIMMIPSTINLFRGSNSEPVSESECLEKIQDGKYIVPVPLHPKRLREREFNQSAIIALVMGLRLGIPVLLDILIRQRHTRPQVELDIKERRNNVLGAFSVQDAEVIKDKDVILVDDVYTTGSTVNECAKALKKNGAQKICVITIARMVG